MAMKNVRGKTDWVVVTPHAAPLENPWQRCPKCRKVLDEMQLERNLYVCPSCGHYNRISARKRIATIADYGTFVEWDADVVGSDPLQFPGYADKVSAAQEKSGSKEAVCCGGAEIGGREVALAVMDSNFMMASMGGAVGEKLTRAIERATDKRLPVIIFCCSGGARMQEGLISLMQMAKVSCALQRHSEAGLLYLSVLTDPTTGGVTASFAMQGDIILSEPKALIGFAGRRVVENTIRKTLPDDFQTAEFALEHGLIDAIVERDKLRCVIKRILALHEGTTNESDIAPEATLEFGLPRADSASKRVFKSKREKKVPSELAAQVVEVSESPQPADLDDAFSAWRRVQLARNTKRPTSQYYIEQLFDGFIELHGDREFSDDASIIGGLAWFNGRAVTVIAQEKGRDTSERIKRNFGCANPEGYRKTLRLMREAEKFNRPVITLVDTQGAYCGVGAEERGQGGAIATNLIELAGLKVPTVGILIGEGGSGGALALALCDKVAMLENAVYSVLSPEGFASILWKDGSRVKEAAQLMKMTAHDAFEMDIVDAIISEPVEGAQAYPEETASNMRVYLTEALEEVCALPVSDLLEKRYQRYRKF